MHGNRHQALSPRLFVLLICFLLTGCGTCLSLQAYNMGVKRPYLENDGEKRTANWYNKPQDSRCVPHQEVYRIGSDYYAKLEFAFMPVKVIASSSSAPYWWTMENTPSLVPQEHSPEVEKSVRYCRLTQEEAAACGLPSFPGSQGAPAVLSEQEAVARTPELVGSYDARGLIAEESARTVQPLYTTGKFARYSATAGAFLLVDLPCTVIPSAVTGAFAVLYVLTFFPR